MSWHMRLHDSKDVPITGTERNGSVSFTGKDGGAFNMSFTGKVVQEDRVALLFGGTNRNNEQVNGGLSLKRK